VVGEGAKIAPAAERVQWQKNSNDEVRILESSSNEEIRITLDHEKLTYRYAGRNFRLTDVAGQVASEIFG